MPEHVHLLVGEPETRNPSKVLQVLKQKVSRAFRGKRSGARKQMAFRFDDEEGETEAFWQSRFYDFNVWGEKKLKEKLEYMHRNPVDRELVKHPRDWPWSSWSFYEGDGKGLIQIDIVGSRGRAREKQSQNPHP
jgi:putative transposase